MSSVKCEGNLGQREGGGGTTAALGSTEKTSHGSEVGNESDRR